MYVTLIVSTSGASGVTAAVISDTETIKVGSGSRLFLFFLFFGGGADHDTEAVAKSAITLYANFIHFVFNELISV